MIPTFMMLVCTYEQFDSGARRFGIPGLSRKVDLRQRQFPDPLRETLARQGTGSILD
jgi:hypothetical protein